MLVILNTLAAFVEIIVPLLVKVGVVVVNVKPFKFKTLLEPFTVKVPVTVKLPFNVNVFALMVKLVRVPEMLEEGYLERLVGIVALSLDVGTASPLQLNRLVQLPSDDPSHVLVAE